MAWVSLCVRRNHSGESLGELKRIPSGPLFVGVVHHAKTLVVDLEEAGPFIATLYDSRVSTPQTTHNGAAGNGWDGVCFHKGSFSLALARLLSFTAFSSVLASSQSNPPRLALGLLE